MNDKDYPVVAMENVAPIFVRQMLLGAMTSRYMRRTDLDHEEAADAACATWDTPWETDPAPRTFEAAVEAVDSDLEHWDEA